MSFMVYVVIQCPYLPPLTHAVPSTNSTDYQTTVIYECLDGYKYGDGLTMGNMLRVCLASGQWTAAVPDCVRK